MSRVCLSPSVASNGESFTVARALRLAAGHGVWGVVTYADPVARIRPLPDGRTAGCPEGTSGSFTRSFPQPIRAAARRGRSSCYRTARCSRRGRSPSSSPETVVPTDSSGASRRWAPRRALRAPTGAPGCAPRWSRSGPGARGTRGPTGSADGWFVLPPSRRRYLSQEPSRERIRRSVASLKAAGPQQSGGRPGEACTERGHEDSLPGFQLLVGRGVAQ